MSATPAHRFETPGPIRLEVAIPAGNLDVVTVAGTEATVTLGGSPKLTAAVTVELVGDRLVVAMRRKTFVGLFGQLDGALEVHVELPHHSLVLLTTASADARLDGTFAGLELKSASGGVTVTGEIVGDVFAKTVSGDVRLPRVAGSLSVQTVSGDLQADAIGATASAKSVSGDVRIASARNGSVNVQSVSGNVAVGISAGTNVDVDAASASGELSSEVLLSDSPGAPGGPTVIVRGKTVSGDFHLFRAADHGAERATSSVEAAS